MGSLLSAASSLEPPVATTLGTLPWWEPPLLFVAIVAVVVYASGGAAPERVKGGASDALAQTRDIDRTLTAHALGVLQQIAILTAGFVTAVRVGALSIGLICANLAALLTTASLAAWGLALLGQPTLIGALDQDARAAQADEAIRRVHRRARLVRVATWCLFPTVSLIAISASVALLRDPP
jgi:hypothetical protein